MKKSYIELLKEAAAGEYTQIPNKVDVKGPMTADILGYEGGPEGYTTKKDAASILERYYFKEQDDATKIDNPVNEEPNTEPLGDKAETKDGKGGSAPMDEIEKELALGDTAGTLKEGDEEKEEEKEEGKEEEKEDADDDDEDKEIEKVTEAIRMLMEAEAAKPAKKKVVAEAAKPAKKKVSEGGHPLTTLTDKEDDDKGEDAKKEMTAENAILSKLIEQMEDAKVDKPAGEEPDTEPAGDPSETKDGKGKAVDVDKSLAPITKKDINEMFEMFREQVEAEEDKEEKKDDEKKDEEKEDDDEEKKLSELESFFMEGEDEGSEEDEKEEEEEDKKASKEDTVA